MLSLLWEKVLQVVPLVNVGTPNMLNLSGTNNSFSRLMACFEECSDIRNIVSEYLDIRILDLLKPIKTWEEGTPVT
jgi:hypothetical protein